MHYARITKAALLAALVVWVLAACGDDPLYTPEFPGNGFKVYCADVEVSGAEHACNPVLGMSVVSGVKVYNAGAFTPADARKLVSTFLSQNLAEGNATVWTLETVSINNTVSYTRTTGYPEFHYAAILESTRTVFANSTVPSTTANVEVLYTIYNAAGPYQVADPATAEVLDSAMLVFGIVQ